MRLIDADALLEQCGLKGAVKYGNKNAEQQHNSYSTLMMYEIADMIDDAPTITSHDWTPCAEGMPEKTADYKVTVQVGSEMGTWRETKIIPYRIVDGVGSWILPKSDWLIYGVIAWTKADEPWEGGLDGK